MAIWQKPPKDAYTLVCEYLAAEYPDGGYSTACDMDKRLIHLEFEAMSDEELGALIATLQTQFPGAF